MFANREKLTAAGTVTQSSGHGSLRGFALKALTLVAAALCSLSASADPELTLVPASITPASGSTLDVIDEVVLTFDEDVYLNPSIQCPVIQKKGMLESLPASWSVSADKHTVTWKMGTPLTDYGVYHLIFVEKSFIDQECLYSNLWSGTATDMIDVVLTIEEIIPDLTYDFTPTDVYPAPGSTVDAIGTVSLTFTQEARYEWGVSKAVVTNAAGETVKTITYFNSYIDGETDLGICEFNLAITDPGTYTLTLQPGTVGTSQWLDCDRVGYSTNPLLEYTYTIAGPAVADIVPATVTPASMSTVEEVSQVVFTFDSPVCLNPAFLCPVISKKGLLDVPAASWELSADGLTLTWTMAETMTDAGTYYLGIVEGALCDQQYLDSDGAHGHYCDQIETYLLIEAKYPPLTCDFAPVSVDPVEGTVDALDTVTLWFNGSVHYEWELAQALITNAAGETVKTITFFNILFDEETGLTAVEINAGITTPGTYTLSIAEATFGSQDWINSEHTGGSCNPALQYVFAIPVPKVSVSYTAKTAVTVGSDVNEAVIASMAFDAEAGTTLAFTVNEPLDANWELVGVTGAGEDLAAGTDGRYTTAELSGTSYPVEASYAFRHNVYADSFTAVETLEQYAGVMVKAESGHVVVTGLQAGDAVTVYAVNGMQLYSGAPDGGNNALSLSLPLGSVYIVLVERAGAPGPMAVKIAI